MGRVAELRAGLAETRRYLLSHHEPAAYDRCHRVPVGDRDVHVCARCAGIYPGIAVAIAAVLTGFLPATPDLQLLLVAILPAPALVDWMATTFRDATGSNPIRTATGMLLGLGYGLGLGRVFLAGDWRVLLVGIGYAILAAVLLRRCGDQPTPRSETGSHVIRYL